MTYEIPSGCTLDTKFMFTKLQVADLDKVASFYTSVLGLIEMHRVEAAIGGRAVSEIVYMPTQPGGPMFILAKFHDTNAPSKNETILGFATGDTDALIARAEKAGGRMLEQLPAGPHNPFLTTFIEDPEGHVLQFSQPSA